MSATFPIMSPIRTPRRLVAVCAPICRSACPSSAQRANPAAIPPAAGCIRPVRCSPSATAHPKPRIAPCWALNSVTEGDLILGAGHHRAIGTLVERATRFIILLHLPTDHTAEAVATFSAHISARQAENPQINDLQLGQH